MSKKLIDLDHKRGMIYRKFNLDDGYLKHDLVFAAGIVSLRLD